ncbi:MAG TPA: S8 family serine peptidase [Acidimicrobiales bacterium]|nr:S8 family serine peptidase [Acidimicrobiales bacterium]
MANTKPYFASDDEIPTSGEVVILFKDGTVSTAATGEFLMHPEAMDKGKLQASGLDPKAAIDSVGRVVAKVESTEAVIAPLYERSPDILWEEAQLVTEQLKTAVPDPAAFSVVTLNAPIDQLEAFAADVSKEDAVVTAYVQPVAYPAAVDIAPPTVQIGPQDHFRPAPLGIDMDYARAIPGARGADVRILDVEGAWRLDHEDLPSSLFLANTPVLNPFDVLQDQHGTAVLGVLAAGANQYGVEGLVPEARIGVATAADVFHLIGGVARGGLFVASVIDQVSGLLGPGDILLIEQHYPGPLTRSADDFNKAIGFVPVEYYPAEFFAIQRLTARGVIVVEPAGNGAQDLDDPIYEGRFDRSLRDSGAIMVGAGAPGSRATLGFSNFGSRVDVQGWGQGVVTTGYGDPDLRFNGDDRRQWYTRDFRGTSSASPIVAGACAAIEGASRAARGAPVSPGDLRQLLVRTGTPQEPGAQIGPLPNLRAALDALNIRRPEGSGWPQLAGGATATTPAIHRNQDGRLEVVGVGGDRVLHHTWQTRPNNGWAPYVLFPSRLPTGIELRGDPVMILSHDGRLEVYALGSDGAIWHSWQTTPNGGWSGWDSLGGSCTDSPAVGSNSDGRLEVFVRWQDGTLHRNWQRVPGWGVSWAGWHRTGDLQLAGAPAVATNADGRLEVFARGSDGLFHHIAQTRDFINPWTDWMHPGGAITGDPACSEFGLDAQRRIVVFAAGVDGRLFHAWQTAPNNGWAQSPDFGGAGIRRGGQVSVCRTSTGGIHLFAHAEDGSMYQRDLLPPAGWSGWRNLGGRISHGPACFANADDRPEVVARGVDGLLVHRWGPF